MNNLPVQRHYKQKKPQTQRGFDRIDRAILYYKADVAVSKGTLNGLEVAIDFLDQATSLEPDDIEAELIEKKKKVFVN